VVQRRSYKVTAVPALLRGTESSNIQAGGINTLQDIRKYAVMQLQVLQNKVDEHSSG
jgi:hypothetical protein